MIKRDCKTCGLIWGFWEDQILLDTEKTLSATALDTDKANSISTNFSMFL